MSIFFIGWAPVDNVKEKGVSETVNIFTLKYLHDVLKLEEVLKKKKHTQFEVVKKKSFYYQTQKMIVQYVEV